MDTELLTVSTGVAGLIGVLSPFVLPFVFKFFRKVIKRVLTTEEKRLVVTMLSVGVSFIIICFSFNWVGDWKEILENFVLEFSANFVIIKGLIQTVYELIIKGVVIDEVPVIDKTLTKLSR